MPGEGHEEVAEPKTNAMVFYENDMKDIPNHLSRQLYNCQIKDFESRLALVDLGSSFKKIPLYVLEAVECLKTES